MGGPRTRAFVATCSGSTRSVFVGGQVAMAALLLVVGTLFARPLQMGLNADIGFEPTGVMVATTNLTPHGYDAETGRAFYKERRTGRPVNLVRWMWDRGAHRRRARAASGEFPHRATSARSGHVHRRAIRSARRRDRGQPDPRVTGDVRKRGGGAQGGVRRRLPMGARMTTLRLGNSNPGT